MAQQFKQLWAECMPFRVSVAVVVAGLCVLMK